MNYRFLAKEGINKLFDESDLSVGEILRTIIRERATGLKCKNISVLTSITSEKWYEVIEKAYEETQDAPIEDDNEWSLAMSKTFGDGK